MVGNEHVGYLKVRVTSQGICSLFIIVVAALFASGHYFTGCALVQGIV
jgi:hypothetical protein